MIREAIEELVTGRSLTMDQASIDGLNGKDMKGRNLTVNQARPREEGGDRRRSEPRW